MIERLQRTKRLIEQASPWKPDARFCLTRDLLHAGRTSGRTNREHVEATIAWLKRAQDATGDGGVAGRYRLDTGFSTSYPETTGYIIPTFLDVAERTGDDGLRARAERMVGFLLGVQLKNGAFPGSEVGLSDGTPCVFNTGQIIQGLVAWYEATKDGRALDAAVRASHWMADVQEPDGSWTKFTYAEKATAYHTRAAWPLAECGAVAGEKRFLEAASRHVDWVLKHADAKSGWIDLMGFFTADHVQRRALTHTIAYTYRGLLELERILERGDCWDVIRTANENLLRRVETHGGVLNAVYDHRWREQANYACLTGAVQVAGIWMRLYRRFGDLRFLNGALKLIDQVKAAQHLDTPHPGVNGAVAGSFPVWGDYIRLAFPNWAAKFHVDALLYADDCLAELRARPPEASWRPPKDLPTEASIAAAPVAAPREQTPPRTVVIAGIGSTKGGEILEALLARGVVPAAVVLDVHKDHKPLRRRLIARLRDGGPARVLRVFRRRFAVTPAAVTPLSRIRQLCARHGVPVVTTRGINQPASIEALRALAPDLFVCAGTAILGEEALRLPSLGSVNAHMGLLPFFRGMNVAEWSALSGAPLGATAHLVERGIDAGPILAVRPVERAGATTLEELRDRVNEAQVELLVNVVGAIVEGRKLGRRVQRRSEGRQFFVMHPALRLILGEHLARAAIRKELERGQAA